ncbi:MAG: hypothetical protein DRP00_03685 [Candidatus Aenigmatarchaeota archaeon]|nr:MAG: hypothetical protein DRP00_03685 [Candidatus Aenigmarchaeota archaeon]
MSTKAQTFSLDFFLALTIFLAGFVLLLIFWNYTNSQIQERKSLDELIDAAFSLSQIWFIEGRPVYWNEQNVKVIGLANENRINQTKLNFLNEMGYEEVKKRLNVGYNFCFRIHNNTHELFSFGLSPSPASAVVKVDRLSILNSTPVIIEVIVWG